jgi:plastocyanin
VRRGNERSLQGRHLLRPGLLLLAAVLGAALAALPALASSEASPTVDAVNEGGVYGEAHHWSPEKVAIVAGSAVTFRNQTEVPHGIEWRSTVKPTCDSSVPVGTTVAASGTNWSGSCTFGEAGTYLYYCTVHGVAMSGTVTVSASGTTTVSTTPPPTTPTSTTPAPGGEPPAAPVLARAFVRPSQHGTAVKGALEVSAAAAGGRLEVDLLAPRASLARARRLATVRVGRLVRASVPQGQLAFAVKLDARARRALRHRHRLALTVKVLLSPPHGAPFLASRHVVEHA